MKSKYSIEKNNSYLCITITGEYDRSEFLLYPKIVTDACEQQGLFRVLINGLNIDGTDLPMMDRFIIGEDIAKTLGSKIKLAVVWPADHINKLAENVAVNRGGFINVVGKVSEAERWLMTAI